MIWFSALLPCFTCISLSNLIAHKLLHKSHHTHRQSHTHTHSASLVVVAFAPISGSRGGERGGEQCNNISGFHFSTICRVCPLGAKCPQRHPFLAKCPVALAPLPLSLTLPPLSLSLSPCCYSSLCATCRSCCRLAASVCLAVFLLAMKRKCNPIPFLPLTTPAALPFALWDRLPSLRRDVECCNQVLARK